MQNPKQKNLDAIGRFAYDLDPVIHEKARLRIIASLATHPEGLVFSDLKELCALTDGNLSRHLQLLNEERLIVINKGFQNNRPQTLCKLTAEGRRRFLDYINVLEGIITDGLGSVQPEAPPGQPFSEGWSPA